MPNKSTCCRPFHGCDGYKLAERQEESERDGGRECESEERQRARERESERRLAAADGDRENGL